MLRSSPVYLILLSVLLAPSFALSDTYGKARAELIAEIEEDVKQTSLYLDKEALDPKVLDSMRTVPRHEFVPEELRTDAYENRPLPIGHGQTISQPYIVAVMTDLLKPKPSHKVLEVGTGSGYQAAVLSGLVDEVYSIEIIEPLAITAKERLTRLGYGNIQTRQGDCYYGWDEAGPFDGIVVTAAASHIPPSLVAQLKPGGTMIIPVGSSFLTQELVVVSKTHTGGTQVKQLLPVHFVPLTGEH